MMVAAKQIYAGWTQYRVRTRSSVVLVINSVAGKAYMSSQNRLLVDYERV